MRTAPSPARPRPTARTPPQAQPPPDVLLEPDRPWHRSTAHNFSAGTAAPAPGRTRSATGRPRRRASAVPPDEAESRRRASGRRDHSSEQSTGMSIHLCALTTTESARSTPSNAQRSSGHTIAAPAYAASTCSQAPARAHASAIAGTGSTAVVAVVPTVATTAAASERSPELLGAIRNASSRRDLAHSHSQHPRRLVDRRVRLLRAHDQRPAGRIAGGRQRGERRGRGGVLDVPVPPVGQPEQLRHPVEHEALELRRRGRGPPQDRRSS